MFRSTPTEVAPLMNCPKITTGKEFFTVVDVASPAIPADKRVTQQGMVATCAPNGGANHVNVSGQG